MRVKRLRRLLNTTTKDRNNYPIPSIVLAVMLLYLTPFTSSLLAVPATAICLYRVIRYDAQVYATDYCIIAPIMALSRVVVGAPLMLYLSLFAAIWYFLRSGFRAEASYAILLILMNYLIMRMQMEINSLVLCFGQMFLLCVLLPEQDTESAERAVKAFCLNLVVSSVYAWVFRNHPFIRNISGPESLAIWGTNIKRFKGLFADPNYFMTLLTVAMALLLKLKDSKRIRNGHFVIMLIFMTVFGILTYSKTFFLMFIMLIIIYVVWQYWNKKVLRGMLLTVVAILALSLIFFMENSPFEVVLTRFKSAKNISDFTTNRSDVYLMYFREITGDLSTFLIGKGFSARGLVRDPHNLYLEISYYIGIVGLLLVIGFYAAMAWSVGKRLRNAPRQNIVAKYEVLLIVFVLYFTLHGMFESVLYAELGLALLSMMLTPKKL